LIVCRAKCCGSIRGPQGLSDNPFYDGDPNFNRSKVYQSGLRNPFRISADPLTGQLYVGDVGWGWWEEINAGPAGVIFVWPFFGGGNGVCQVTTRSEKRADMVACDRHGNLQR